VKVGDLVRWVHDVDSDNEVGVVVNFDLDNDPVIVWQSDGIACKYGEYRSQVEVVNYESW